MLIPSLDRSQEPDWCSNVLGTLIDKWAVMLPPVLTILAVVIVGALFGIPGMIVAAPLMIVVTILVRKLYIEGALSDQA